ncbi:invasion protein CiaB [Candidatus Marinarcus aquaticus]|uniref:CiaB protein n=1 Tax=Candidatus Marinarcus aquaticus TaxID=2044504 RepID=A0A4V1LPC9_9BACT|nr:invasion protein CiaB [Candidatus Marinarcus aquaticus]RXJ60758.1 CiaB protein [Candidatus Marinarcus aquaticus]
MNETQFLDDISKIYTYLDDQKNEINGYITALEDKAYDKLELIESFAQHLQLENIDDNLRLALITRLVNLRDDSLVQVLKKMGKNEKEVIELQEKAYGFVRDFWHDKHQALVFDFIKGNNLLTPFYQAVFEGVYEVGLCMSSWQSAWTGHIINGINKALLEQFDGDEAKVYAYLEENELFDLGHNGQTADRSYSALVEQNDGSHKSEAYIKAFKEQTTAVVNALETFADRLIELEDEIYGQKWDYVLYIQSLIKAFSEDEPNKLVEQWANVDRAWMKIKTPIQIGHPLEYYEDHFRKAVALEWDIRLSNPKFEKNAQRVEKMKNMFTTMFHSLDFNNPNYKEHKSVFDFSMKSLDKVQLYIGRPALFFGAEFNGLFSAQVVPNDEIVSLEEGKKIFAFSDEILQTSRAKPFLKLSQEIFGQEFLSKDRTFLFQEEKKWHQVYDITTIGHEYGHILWCDDETESVMNKTGNFKNIEEFKATTGGLVSFFIGNSESELSEQVLIDTVKRAVGLMGWMEVDEVQPYYCEGIIHLTGLFESRVLSWENEQLNIDLSPERYEALKKWYINTYQALALHYLNKKDASEFLNQYAKKEGKYFMPVNPTIYNFVTHYFERYKAIGQELDTQDKKSNYIKDI